MLTVPLDVKIDDMLTDSDGALLACALRKQREFTAQIL